MHVTLTCMYIVTLLCTVVTCIMHDVCALHHAMLLTLLWCDTCMLPSVLDIAHIQVLTSSSTLTCCLLPFCSTPLPSSHDTGSAGGENDHRLLSALEKHSENPSPQTSADLQDAKAKKEATSKAKSAGGKYICTLILFSYMHVHCDIVVYCCWMYYA